MTDFEDIERRAGRVEKIARWLDGRFVIPGTKMRFGLDSLVGLLPGIGDAATAIVGLWLIVEAARLGASRPVVIQMIVNWLIDSVLGSVPVAGDLFDVFWRSNQKNAKLLRQELDRKNPKSNSEVFLMIERQQGRRFVTLLHRVGPNSKRIVQNPEAPLNTPKDHWDWMFETPEKDSLLTWATDPIPKISPSSQQRFAAIRLTDHRTRYLDFEGDIGGDRGTVERLIAGTYLIGYDRRDLFSVHLNIDETAFRTLEKQLSIQFESVPSTASLQSSEIAPEWILSIR